MKVLKRALLVFAFLASGALAGPAAELETGAQAPLPPHPELYSFADIYRLAVYAPTLPAPASEPLPVRFAVAPGATLSAGPRFSVSAISQREGWMLLVAGLAATGWVAHRRLANAL
ncbi:MAG TPA: hypothetical protein VFC18_05255 [Burkholderiales bacterium]|nr:hypothetical protein [Burkholderiales bacterium]